MVQFNLYRRRSGKNTYNHLFPFHKPLLPLCSNYTHTERKEVRTMTMNRINFLPSPIVGSS
jgi:hypothetical protein